MITPAIKVSMHLLVLGAFRPNNRRAHPRHRGDVSMHLLVLGAFRQIALVTYHQNLYQSQCTFWCLVLSDWTLALPGKMFMSVVVSMHLLVLGAFRHVCTELCCIGHFPSQCTFWCLVLSDGGDGGPDGRRHIRVSMHLLVLGAFRPQK